MSDILWALPLTLAAFFLMRSLSQRFAHPLLNPLLWAIVLIVPVLLVLHVPYPRYFAGNHALTALMQPSVVALAFPLYKQLPQIVRRWKLLLVASLSGSLVALVSGAALVLLLGGDKTLAASVLPKSVTTPIAIAVADSVHGVSAISVLCVVVVGIFGGVFGHPLLNALGIRSKAARGMAIGASSHVIGTARAAQLDWEEGAFSSLALVLCGLWTVLLAPWVFQAVLVFFGR